MRQWYGHNTYNSNINNANINYLFFEVFYSNFMDHDSSVKVVINNNNYI